MLLVNISKIYGLFEINFGLASVHQKKPLTPVLNALQLLKLKIEKFLPDKIFTL